MCSKCRPHPAPMPALGKVVGEHTMPCKSSLHQKKKKSQHKPVKNNQLARTPLGLGGQEHYLMWRKKSLEIGAGKPNSGLSFISGLCVTLDKSTYLLGSLVSFLAKWKGWSVGGKKKKKEMCALGGGRSCARGKWAGWRLRKKDKFMLCRPQPQAVVTQGRESRVGSDAPVWPEVKLSYFLIAGN